jgi:excisionase family DNA binding protein
MSKSNVLPSHQVRIGEACKILGLSRFQVRRLADTNQLRSIKRGSERILYREEVLRNVGAFRQSASNVQRITDEGRQHAEVLRMMQDGTSNTSIVLALALPIDLVIRLRREFEADREAEAKRRATSNPYEEQDAAVEAAVARRTSEPRDTLVPPPMANGAAR